MKKRKKLRKERKFSPKYKRKDGKKEKKRVKERKFHQNTNKKQHLISSGERFILENEMRKKF